MVPQCGRGHRGAGAASGQGRRAGGGSGQRDRSDHAPALDVTTTFAGRVGTPARTRTVQVPVAAPAAGVPTTAVPSTGPVGPPLRTEMVAPGTDPVPSTRRSLLFHVARVTVTVSVAGRVGVTETAVEAGPVPTALVAVTVTA